MGIYIKGMEMPKSCEKCPAFHNTLRCGITAFPFYSNERHERRMHDCPLVPVPPHGDLIERDPLRASIRESIDECHKWADEMREAENDEMVIRAEQSLGTFVECGLRVKNAPTIIPADPVKEVD